MRDLFYYCYVLRSFFVIFFEYITCKSSARNYCVLVEENPETFTERCSLITCILQGVAKIFKKYVKVNHFLRLSCSLEKQLLIEWFFNYSTRSPCIVPLSSLLGLFWGNLLECGQLFSGKILWWGAIFRGGIFLGCNCPRTIFVTVTSNLISELIFPNLFFLLLIEKSIKFINENKNLAIDSGRSKLKL